MTWEAAVASALATVQAGNRCKAESIMAVYPPAEPPTTAILASSISGR